MSTVCFHPIILLLCGKEQCNISAKYLLLRFTKNQKGNDYKWWNVWTYSFKFKDLLQYSPLKCKHHLKWLVHSAPQVPPPASRNGVRETPPPPPPYRGNPQTSSEPPSRGKPPPLSSTGRQSSGHGSFAPPPPPPVRNGHTSSATKSFSGEFHQFHQTDYVIFFGT